jgi:hypothetical protein
MGISLKQSSIYYLFGSKAVKDICFQKWIWPGDQLLPVEARRQLLLHQGYIVLQISEITINEQQQQHTYVQ